MTALKKKMKVIKTNSFVKLCDRVEHPPVYPFGDRMTNIINDDIPDKEKVKRDWKKKKRKKVDTSITNNQDIIPR
jgi:hypothetical protein